MSISIWMPSEKRLLVIKKQSDGDCARKTVWIKLDLIQCGALSHLIMTSERYSRHLETTWKGTILTILPTFPRYIPLVRKSSALMLNILWEAIEMEDALHWLSTLGGAYSNLGDHSRDFAFRAGKNAIFQMIVSKRSHNPSLHHKCMLFVAMSHMQLGEFKQSRQIIEYVFESNKNRGIYADKQVSNMCKGIWARLRFACKRQALSKKMITKDSEWVSFA